MLRLAESERLWRAWLSACARPHFLPLFNTRPNNPPPHIFFCRYY